MGQRREWILKLAVLSASAQSKASRFQDYPVTESFEGSPAPVVLAMAWGSQPRPASRPDRFQKTDRRRRIQTLDRNTSLALLLLSKINLKLRPKLLADLKPGTRVVSNTFDMDDWKPDKQAAVGDPTEGLSASHTLYLWVVPMTR